jgi:Domain of unknown function (DUF4214)
MLVPNGLAAPARFLSFALAAWALLAGGVHCAFAAVPAQFVAKLYTEALGRAPDPQAWASAVASFEEQGCNQAALTAWGSSVFASAEFQALPYDNAAIALLVYRAFLNREPDLAGFNAQLSALAQGQSPSQIVAELSATQEFAQLAPYICSGRSYSFGTLGSGQALQIPSARPGGYGGLSEAQLQSLLNSTGAGQTIYLQQESVIFVTQPLVIPAGVTLSTYGQPGPRRHALMARLVRTAAFASPMVQINLDDNPNPSGSLKSIWVDGQRQLSSAFVQGAINLEIYGGAGATVDSNFFANSLGWSNIHSYGALDGRPCAGNTITNNLITAYSSVHADQQWTDGISAGCERSVIENNQIVDATDVGIVVFTAYPSTQTSTVTGNTIISAGNSAFGGMGFDPLQDRSAGAPDFTGSSISNNTLWSGPNSHFVIGLAVGSRPWYAQGSIGHGAEMSNNTTGGIQTQFGAAIVVSGMQQATVNANTLDAKPIPQSWTSCPIGNVLASVTAGLASGSIQPYSDVEVNGCMSDSDPSSSAVASAAGASADRSTSSVGASQSASGGGGAFDALSPEFLALALALRLLGRMTRSLHVVPKHHPER